MEPLQPQVVERQLLLWVGADVVIHLEVNPGAYWRNGQAKLRQAHVRGEGPFRVFLELDEIGLIHIDDLTHMNISDALVVCTAYDELERLTRTVEISLRPLAGA